jgi:hypothetical protein
MAERVVNLGDRNIYEPVLAAALRRVWLTDLTLSCAARAHVATAERRAACRQ